MPFGRQLDPVEHDERGLIAAHRVDCEGVGRAQSGYTLDGAGR